MSSPSISDLPRDILVSILQKAVVDDGGLNYALVCKSWFQLSPMVQTHINLRQDHPLKTNDLLKSLALFPNVTRLYAPCGSLCGVDDELLYGLSVWCKSLVQLHVGFQSPRSRFFEAGLANFFQSCTRLKELSLDSLGDVTYIPQELGLLSGLKCLSLGDWDGSYSWKTYPNLVYLPESISSLVNLTEFSVVSRSLHTLPESFGKLHSLENLRIHSVELVSLPPTIGCLSNLQTLQLRSQLLSSFPTSICHLSKLKFISLSYCNCLYQLPETFGELSSLEEIDILNCYALLQLPSTFGNLRALRRLRVRGCAHLSTLPASFTELPLLDTLTLQFARRLETLPDDFGNLKSLTRLELETCDRLAVLPESFGRLERLSELSIVGCRGLTGLPSSFLHLESIQELTLKQCDGLHYLPKAPHHYNAENNGVHPLSTLKKLIIRDCPIVCVTHTFCNFKSLVYLELEGPSIDQPWEELSRLGLEVCLDGTLQFTLTDSQRNCD